MELPVKVESCLRPDSTGFLVCSGKDYNKLIRPIKQAQGQKILEQIINKMGALSAKAQGLKQTITSSIKFFGSDHRIYIKAKENLALGFMKVGEKKLFYRDYIGKIKELTLTCVLDIYVHQSCQRSGIGKEVFEKFLTAENRTPQKLAYDRPSEKLLCFLKKYYNLAKYIPQNNNFVIYDRYFDKFAESSFKKIQEKEKPTLKDQLLEEEAENISSRNNQMKKLTSTFTNLSVDHQKHKKESKDFSMKMESRNGSRHKNTTSEDFPFFGTQYDNPMFRTTSASYGHYYRKK